MGIRRVAPYPAEKFAALQEAVQIYAPATLPQGAGRRIALPRRHDETTPPEGRSHRGVV
jgi:hypothetical protein